MRSIRGIGVLILSLGATLLLLAVLKAAPAGAQASCVPSGGTPLFVKYGRSGSNCTQDSPCGSLQYALDLAAPAGDVIYVAAGTFTGTGSAVVTITKSVALCGGWDGFSFGGVQRDPDLHITILDGENVRRVVFITGSLAVDLDGLTLAHGYQPGSGAGIYAHSADLNLSHVNLISNSSVISPGSAFGAGFYVQGVDLMLADVNVAGNAVSSTMYAYGGGGYASGGTLHVMSSTFSLNWVQGSETRGGGLYVDQANAATIEHGRFEANDAWRGSGLRVDGSTLLVRHTHFQDNGRSLTPGPRNGGYGGGMYLQNTQTRIQDCAFVDNEVKSWGGALYVSGGTLWVERSLLQANQANNAAGISIGLVVPFTLTNNVIVGNQPYTRTSVGGVLVYANSTGRVLHNTIAGNTRQVGGSPAGLGLKIEPASVVDVTDSILAQQGVAISVTSSITAALDSTLWYGNAVNWAGPLVHKNDRSGDPAFVNPAAGDYHVSPASPAVDAGVDAGVSDDFDGDPRPISRPDIGADEAGTRVYLPVVLREH